MINKQNDIVSYYREICILEGLSPLPIKFNRVGKGGACLEFNSITMKPLNIQFDLSKLMDIERALLHETAHQILITTKKDPALKHNAAFRKIENYLIDKYMYSKISFKYKL